MNGVAMVFVSWDEGHVLIPALESLFDSKPQRDLEIVVVDNASTDGAKEHIESRWPQIRVLERDRPHGLPSNLNHGVRSTESPYVMFCNPDLIFREGSVDSLAEFFDEHERAGLVAPVLLSPDGEPRTSARRWYTARVLIALKGPWRRFAGRLKSVQRNLYEDWDMSSPIPVDWVPCPATMARRAALDKVGLMDERFRLYFDDVDISLRMHKGGWEVWCLPSSKIIHLEQRSSIRPMSRPWRWHLESLIKFWWKHKGLGPSR
jgi:N-acetylglucosaminyl-diphospho-decaprenol L-rhamnosyltransferase